MKEPARASSGTVPPAAAHRSRSQIDARPRKAVPDRSDSECCIIASIVTGRKSRCKREHLWTLGFADAEDARGRIWRVDVVNEGGAAFENGALVQRAFVGDFAGVERGRFLEDDCPLDAIGIAGGLRGEGFEQRRKFR